MLDEFKECLEELRQMWRAARYQDNNLTFQEFLLVWLIFLKENTNG